ncbi:MAG: sensor histidine kinase [bacterium]|nr:sensor histidine kinase [Candidatus Aquidulcis frankliniae]
MPLRDEFKGEGIEALLARTRRQMSLFILGATALIVALVGVGGAVAGNSALDAGLDNALVARAERIVLEIQEELPPLPESSPLPSTSPDPSASPSESEEPGESEQPEDAKESEKPDDKRSPRPSGDIPMPSGDPEDEGDDDGDESGRAPSATTVLFVVTRGAHRDDAPPSIPPGLTDEEFGAGGPWAVLDANGAILARSAGGSAEFPVITLIDATATRPIAKTVLIGRTEFRVVTTPIRHPQDPNGKVLGYVQVAGRLDVRDAQRQNLFGSLVFVALLSLGGALVMALLIARRALAPIAAAAARERALVASASHELRTPASVILSSAEILEREGLVKPAGLELLHGIAAESERLGRLSADLLTLSSRQASAEGGERMVTVDLQRINLDDVAREAVERAGPLVKRVGLGLRADIGRKRLTIAGDTDRLIQLVLGLVENAIRHSPARSSITIGTSVTEGLASIWVDDEGPGVPLSERERIFEPFYRGAGQPRGHGGAGLGLAVARSIAAAHGGTIAAETALGGGARLIVRIPLATKE